MTTSEVAALLHVHRSTVERWRFEGVGPKPRRITARTVRYVRAEVEQVIDGG